MALLLSLCLHPPNLQQNPTAAVPHPTTVGFHEPTSLNSNSKRHFILKTASLCLISLIPKCPVAQSSQISPTSKQGLPGLANTKSWFQFYGDGFSIRVPPQFEDLTEPEVWTKYLTDFCLFNRGVVCVTSASTNMNSLRLFTLHICLETHMFSCC